MRKAPIALMSICTLVGYPREPREKCLSFFSTLPRWDFGILQYLNRFIKESKKVFGIVNLNSGHNMVL